MNPQTPIDQVPDEQLATFGWNIRETQDNHRRQIEVCEQQLQAIRQEFVRRAQLRQGQSKAEVDAKKAEQDEFLDRLLKKLEERNGHPVAKDVKEGNKAE